MDTDPYYSAKSPLPSWKRTFTLRSPGTARIVRAGPQTRRAR